MTENTRQGRKKKGYRKSRKPKRIFPRGKIDYRLLIPREKRGRHA